jgi:hypothetical protein
LTALGSCSVGVLPLLALLICLAVLRDVFEDNKDLTI